MLPAKDEAVGIGRTLQSILRAGLLPADVYVIDDGSSDGTGNIARSFNVNVARNEKNIGKAHSLARLASACDLVRRYDYVCLMDADTQVSENYFQSIRESFVQPEVAVVCAGPEHSAQLAYRLPLPGVLDFARHSQGRTKQHGRDHGDARLRRGFPLGRVRRTRLEQRHHRRRHGLHHPGASQKAGPDRLPEARRGFHRRTQDPSRLHQADVSLRIPAPGR